MSGIRPSNKSAEWTDEACGEIYEVLKKCKDLFVRSTGNVSVTNDIIKCNSYDAIYVDKFLELNVNQLVAKKEFADFDSATKHLIERTVDWNSLASTPDLEEDWDSDETNGSVFDAGSYMNRPEGERKSQFFDADSDGSEKEFDIHFDEDEIRKLVSRVGWWAIVSS